MNRRKASIIVMAVIIAAGALFTAVYDVLKRSDLSHANPLNAATVSHTGETTFGVIGTYRGCDISTTVEFDGGTYMMLFWGQSYHNNGYGAVCLAFYKTPDNTTSSMTVKIGTGSALGYEYDGGRISVIGSGKTTVTTNFAKPLGYSGNAGVTAIASGSGGSNYSHYGSIGVFKGTEGGWKAGGGYGEKKDNGDWCWYGSAATQTTGGMREDGVVTPSGKIYGSSGGGPGGAGYKDGGGGYGNWAAGGGGSCTPWCYPLYAGDVENGPSLVQSGGGRNPYEQNGGVKFYRIDPTTKPSGQSKQWTSSVSVTLQNAGGTGPWTPKSAVKNSHTSLANYDCGINVSWVYQVSEDGGSSWYGVAPDRFT